MAISAVGVRTDLVGPPPVAPPHSLLNTPGVVQEGAGRWMNGVNLLGYPADTPSLWEPCSEGTFREKEIGTDRPQALFDPFVVYLPVTCSTFGYADLVEQAEAVLAAVGSMGVESGLAAGVDGSANPYFGDVNLNVLVAGAVSPGVALSYLEDAIGQTGRKGMIHATPSVIAALQAFPVGDEDTLVTANGTPVVSGDGYIGVVPDGEAALNPGESWVFATGPVVVRLSAIETPDLASSLDRSDNTVTFRSERVVLAVWDVSLQAGVLVDWAT